MPLPNPDYITQRNYKWNEETNLIGLLNSTASEQTLLFWWLLASDLREEFHSLAMLYTNKAAQIEANALSGGSPAAGWQVADFGGTIVGGNPSGLAAQIYTASATIDGVVTPISVDGTTATTFTTVVGEINTSIGGAGTATITGGDIIITSATTGTSSTVELIDIDLFATLTGFIAFNPPNGGVSSIYPAAGWQVADFGGTVVGGNPSGLAAQTYTASATIDGVVTPISVDGTTAITFSLVIGEINTSLGGVGTATITNTGDIDITSATTGTSSTVELVDVDLFATLNGFITFDTPNDGAVTILDVLNSYIYKGFPIRSQFMGSLYTISNKPHVKGGDISNTAMYVDNSDGIWKYIATELPV